MRRWMLLLLLFVLPLQALWAAAAPYCQHEVLATGTGAAGHFGHHAHAHVEAPDPHASPASLASAGADHADCAGCHSASGVVPASLARLPVPHAPRQLSDAPAASLPEPLSTRPERPQWRN